MRGRLMCLGLFAALASPAYAAEAAPAYHMVRGDFDYGRSHGDEVFTWDGEAFIGGDYNKLWFRSEGETRGGRVVDGEVQALWSHNIADFWDTQAGLRVDLEPDTHAYLTFGVEGLAPYNFETEAALFVRDDGDISARFKQTIDVLLTQRLVLEPHVELNAYAQADHARDIGAGIANVNGGLQIRYEITRQVAPYLDLTFDRALGETENLVRHAGDDPSETMLRAGIRLWF